MTYTYALLEVSESTYNEIHSKLQDAGYDHALEGGCIDMNGIALTLEQDPSFEELSDKHDAATWVRVCKREQDRRRESNEDV